MSPVSELLHELRMRHEVRKSEPAEMLGYEQSYTRPAAACSGAIRRIPAKPSGPRLRRPSEIFSPRCPIRLHLRR